MNYMYVQALYDGIGPFTAEVVIITFISRGTILEFVSLLYESAAINNVAIRLMRQKKCIVRRMEVDEC